MTEPLEIQALRGERTLLHRCLALALVVVEFYINSARGAIRRPAVLVRPDRAGWAHRGV